MVPLELRLEGGSTCQPGDSACQGGRLYFAAGGVKGVGFVEGEVQQTEVPFNQRLLYRQPQVTQVNPENGAGNLAAQSFEGVVVIFSKHMNPDSVRRSGTLRVLKVDGGAETEVPASLVTLTNLGASLEAPAMAEYRFTEGLGQGSYRVVVSTAALDTSGRRLDQVPMQPGDQPFTSSFVVSQASRPETTCSPCSSWCSQGGSECAPGLVCDTSARLCRPATCPSSCPAGTVCNPSPGALRARLPGAQKLGGCPAGETCLASGLCSS